MMYYCRGSVATTTPIGRPTQNKITAWANAMSDAIAASGYQAHVVGRCLYDINSTRDVDISYTGTIHDPQVLRDLLNTSVAVGFEHDLLIDARWDSNPVSARYNNNVIELSLDTFICVDYYEEDDGQGSRIVRDYSLNPRYTQFSPGLVSSSYARVGVGLKPHQIQAIQAHGQLSHMPLSEFINAK